MATMTLETRAFPIAPSTWNAEARTFQAVISTGADVQRRDSRGPFIERLDTSAIDPASLAAVVVLDGHRQTGSEHVVGTVLRAWREGVALVAEIRLSAAEDVRSVVQKVAEQILRGISVGYAVTRWIETTDPQTKARIRTAAKWTIREVSLVGIPADTLSHIRSEDAMTTQTETDTTPVIHPPAVTETRAAVNAQIRSLAETAGLDRTWADTQIDAGADIHAARAAAFDAMAQRSAGAPNIRAHVDPSSGDNPDVIATRQADALAQRMGGAEASEAAQQYVGLSFVDHARAALVRAGERVENLSPEAILTRAMQTTSDFPLLLEQGGHRVLSTAYQAAESPLKEVAVRREVSDLRDVTVLKLGEGSGLEKVNEAGEITYGAFGEGAETYKVETFGKIFTLSRKLLLNDQFGVFGDMLRQMGQLAASTEANALLALLTKASGAGPTMSDGKPLFHADHGNLAASGGPLSIATLSAARQAMRSQKGLDGKTPVGVRPAYLVVGPALETEAEQILATLAATKADDVNPFSGSLQLIVEPRITGKQWYVFGDKATAPVLEIATLTAAPGPQIASREGWSTLGREYRVTLDLGVGVTDWRGAYRNAGA